MFHRFGRILAEAVIASLIIGTILTHFGITADQLIKAAGLSPDHIDGLARAGFAKVLPDLALSALFVVPACFVLSFLRASRERKD